MNAERAIEIITNKVQDGKTTEEQDLALWLVQQFTEKQIPKRPVNRYSNEYVCPVCHGSLFEEDNYCATCGQLLDWRADEREREREIEL